MMRTYARGVTVLAGIVALGACSSGDDSTEDSATVQTPATTVAATSTVAPTTTTTTPPTTTTTTTPPTTEAPENPLEATARVCRLLNNLADEGTTLVVDLKGDEDLGGDDFEDLDCVYEQLAIPTRITARMEATRALDGMQSAEWDEFAATWTFHPDAGLNIILSLNE